MKGQSGTFDTDICESLNGMASKLRLLRSLLSVLNLENHIMFKKNKVFEWLRYLKECYPEIHDLLYKLTFEEYCLRDHMAMEHQRKRSLNKNKLKYFCDRIGIVGDRKKKNLSNSQTSKQRQKANKGNLNYTKKKATAPQTKQARRITAEENKKRKKRDKEKKEAMLALNRNKNQKKTKVKKVKIKDLLEMAKINKTIVKYGLFVENVMRNKNHDLDNDTDYKIDGEELEGDTEGDDDRDLIQECFDELSETESDIDQFDDY